MDQPLFNHKLLRKVLYFEWALLAICVEGELLAMNLGPTDPSSPNIGLSLIFLGIVAALSFVMPTRSGYWDKLCFLFLELVLISGAAGAGIGLFVFPLFMVVIAKACLILDRAGLFITVCAALLAQLAYGAYKIWVTIPQVQLEPATDRLITMLGGSLVANYAAIALTILVAVLTLSLVSEQRARFETMRLSKEVEALAAELERTRIAREIHDSLGHRLTSLSIQLEVAKKFHELDGGRSAQALELARELASQSLKDVRVAVQSLRSNEFDAKSAIDSLIEETKRAGTIDIKATIALPELPPSAGYQLYRLAQESLTNVMRHAEASQVELSITQSDESVVLSITDNGKGTQNIEGREGFGIQGMRERCEALRGTFHLKSEVGKGTTVTVNIPLSEKIGTSTDSSVKVPSDLLKEVETEDARIA